MKQDVEESLEIDKRKCNLVFHGVKESGPDSLDKEMMSPDQDFVEEILKVGLHLDASRHMEKIQRIGKHSEGKTRLLRVKIRTFDARNEILKRAS